MARLAEGEGEKENAGQGRVKKKTSVPDRSNYHLCFERSVYAPLTT